MRVPRLLQSALVSSTSHGSKTRARIRIVLAGLVVLDAILVVLVFRPPGPSLAERQAELQRTRATYEQTLATVQQMRELRTKMQFAIHNDQGFSKEHFLDRRTAFSAMLADLERLASQNQLKTQTIGYQLKEDTKEPGFVNVGVAISVEGSYPDLMRFINRLEQSDLFWVINSLNVVNAAGRGLRLNLQMETYAVSSS